MKGKYIHLDVTGHAELAYDEKDYDEASKAFSAAVQAGMVGIKTKGGESTITKVFDPNAEIHETIVPLVGG